MTNIAIICEYNPMHNGHIYQIKKIKEIFPNSNIIAIMSGSFVQRGDFSIINKYDKAKIAIKNYVDLVLELPTIASLQSADNFSLISIDILNKLEIVDYLSFGIESSNINNFYKNVEYLFKNEQEIYSLQKKYLNQGNSYKKSFILATKEYAKNNNFNLDEDIFMPNNTLAIQYLKTLKLLSSKIKPLPILRQDGGYHSYKIDNYEFQSATTIRNMISKNLDISKFVPREISEFIHKSTKFDIDYLTTILRYNIEILNKNPENISGFENGILNLITKNLDKKISDAIEKSHNKRYSKSRLRRFIMNYLLDIKNEDVENIKNINYIHPLAFNKKGINILNQIKRNNFLIISKYSDIYKLNKIDRRIYELDLKAFKLSNINNVYMFNKIYSNIPFTEI